jgi:hypothetical protein
MKTPSCEKRNHNSIVTINHYKSYISFDDPESDEKLNQLLEISE